MNYATIGWLREDGDIDILACLNNSGGQTPEEFDTTIEGVLAIIRLATGRRDVQFWYRQAAPDVVTGEDSTATG